MERLRALLFLLFSFFIVRSAASKTYIVYMGSKPDDVHSDMLAGSHHDMLAAALNSVDVAKESLLYSYNKNMNGFAAIMEPEHAEYIRSMPGVVSVFESKNLKPQTTRSWQFLGLEDQNGNAPSTSLWSGGNYGQDVIIGVVDTGVWPESASFSDAGLGPIPSRWRGQCETGPSFSQSNCNRKLIGARYFVKGYVPKPEESQSPRDTEGHGTHVSSTAAGAYVPGANMLGFATGTAKGGAPQARIASYKICWSDGCNEARVLAAIDQAISDGVDVINLSIGRRNSSRWFSFLTDSISLGSLHAIQKGIYVVAAGGNDGPSAGTISNIAPWITNVAASTIDRAFPSDVRLGDGRSFTGRSFSATVLPKGMYPLVYSRDIPSAGNSTDSAQCNLGSIDTSQASGKIVICESDGQVAPTVKGEAVVQAGGVGMIMANGKTGRERLFSFKFPLPAVHMGQTNSTEILAYLRSSSNPVGYVTPAKTLLGYKPAPVMGVFSSVGPSFYPDLLKPDVTAPGVDILAAWTEATSSSDKYEATFGTSMASPHVAGVLALLKALHPDWSPAAARSALMTTAYTKDNTGNKILDGDFEIAGPFNYGSGHISPNAATDPGLVYDATIEDYAAFLCSLGYDRFSIARVLGITVSSCVRGSATSFNNPSVAISDLRGTSTITRSVTHVADSPSTYSIYINRPNGVTVTATPSVLQFSQSGEVQTFSLTFTATQTSGGNYVFGDYVWDDGQHQVRSPIVVRATSTVGLVSDA